MEQRIKSSEKVANVLKTLYGIGSWLSKSSVGQPLLNLVYFRVSQINSCAFCLDMHSKDLRAKGETEQRLYLLDAWRDAPFYTDRERAALAWAEALTKITNGNIPDEIYREAKSKFSEEELIDLTLAVTTINTYNRFNLAFSPVVGSYKPGDYE